LEGILHESHSQFWLPTQAAPTTTPASPSFSQQTLRDIFSNATPRTEEP
jgi:hypothetical protein